MTCTQAPEQAAHMALCAAMTEPPARQFSTGRGLGTAIGVIRW
ncbi:hypothetical protein ACWGLF_04390 [Streptomyces puniciscabiei]